MSWLFALFFLVPAIASAAVFWSIWRLIRLFELSLPVRRALFVLLGTLLLSPILIPAGTIMTAWVPHSVILVLGGDARYYLHFAHILLPSFAITSVLFLLLGWWQIKAEAPPLKLNWTTFAIPMAIALLIVGVYRYFVPDRDIASELTVSSIEKIYGADFDDVIALHSMDDPLQQASEISRLKEDFREDQAVIRVSLEDPGTQGSVYGRLFYYVRDQGPPSKSCSGVSTGNQVGLKRCTWSFSPFNRVNVLEYTRNFQHGDEELELVVEFEYARVVEVVRQ